MLPAKQNINSSQALAMIVIKQRTVITSKPAKLQTHSLSFLITLFITLPTPYWPSDKVTCKCLENWPQTQPKLLKQIFDLPSCRTYNLKIQTMFHKMTNDSILTSISCNANKHIPSFL